MNEIMFFYNDELLEEVKGPYTRSQLGDLLFRNVINDQTKVVLEGSEEWVTYSEIHLIIAKEKQKRDKEEKQNDHISAMAPFVAFTSQLNGVSYLDLTLMERFKYYEKIQELAIEFEKRSLHKEEIQFLKAWSILKDKDLGENLLAKLEMNRIQESKGTGSSSSVIKWMGLMAVGQSQARQNLRSMESDLDRLADGIIGEDDVEDGGEVDDGEGFGEFM